MFYFLFGRCKKFKSLKIASIVMMLELKNKELKKTNQVIPKNVKFILRSPVTKDCCVWFKRRQGKAAHHPTSDGAHILLGDRALAK